ncbi:MAG TPA: hypothetical protein VHJ77_13665 [Vicinamibacterales bacterium]|nr:hypothetical protein [Vicinamibacterales bacterium]
MQDALGNHDGGVIRFGLDRKLYADKFDITESESLLFGRNCGVEHEYSDRTERKSVRGVAVKRGDLRGVQGEEGRGGQRRGSLGRVSFLTSHGLRGLRGITAS